MHIECFHDVRIRTWKQRQIWLLKPGLEMEKALHARSENILASERRDAIRDQV